MSGAKPKPSERPKRRGSADAKTGFRYTEDGRYRYRASSGGDFYYALFIPLWLSLSVALAQHWLYFPSGDAGFGLGHIGMFLIYLVSLSETLYAITSPVGMSFILVGVGMVILYRVAKSRGWLNHAVTALIIVDLAGWAHMFWPVLWRVVG